MLDSFIDILGGAEWDEKPVGVREFVNSPEYLNLPPLSALQYQMVEAMTQIYRLDTLISLYGEEDGFARWGQTFNEVILQLGKGSGKDYTSTIACAYIVYLLLCLKDPAVYYGKPPGDAIDIINIAINAQQAKNVFFKGFKQRIDNSPWFRKRDYNPKADVIEFEKSISVHSGHSERESWEGYNVLVVILDEISGFAQESTTGHTQAKTGEDIYKMYAASVSSRFPEFGKLLLLSFPRYKNDFIQQRYNQVVGQKTVIMRSVTLIANPELPEDLPGNSIVVEWEEDHILSYTEPRVFALRRPTWEVNPLQKIENLTRDFMRDYTDALSRFACMPPDAVDAFFKSRAKIEEAFSNPNWAIDETGNIADWFKPDMTKEYFIHVDLAQKIDRCAVALAHVKEFVDVKINSDSSYQPVIVVDAIRWWTPNSQHNVDFADVREFILDLYRMGFNIKLVTFDRWNSVDIMEQLRGYGIETDTLSVGRPHYQDMSMVLSESRLDGPNNEILIEELLQLRAVGNNKVDHPRKGSKDLSDAVCGAIYNADKHTARDFTNRKIDKLHTYSTMVDDRRDRERASDTRPGKRIEPPRAAMPEELSSFLDRMRVVE